MKTNELISVMMSSDKAVGWTNDAEWADRWASQYYLRRIVRNVPKLSSKADLCPMCGRDMADHSENAVWQCSSDLAMAAARQKPSETATWNAAINAAIDCVTAGEDPRATLKRIQQLLR